MKTDQYAELRAALYHDALEVGGRAYEDIRALLAERDAKDAEITVLRHALRKSAAVLAGLEMNKSALVHALELTRAALTQQEQGK